MLPDYFVCYQYNSVMFYHFASTKRLAFLKSASSILHAALKAFCPNPTYVEGGNNKGHKINAHTENYDILKLN